MAIKGGISILQSGSAFLNSQATASNRIPKLCSHSGPANSRPTDSTKVMYTSGMYMDLTEDCHQRSSVPLV